MGRTTLTLINERQGLMKLSGAFGYLLPSSEGFYLLYDGGPSLFQDAVAADALYLGELCQLISTNSSTTTHAFVNYTTEYLGLRGVDWGSALGAH